MGNTFRHKSKKGIIKLSEKVRISDPSYDMNVWCAGTLDILPGKYECRYERKHIDEVFNDERITNIEIRHEKYLSIEPKEKSDIHVGVDSGQAGIFDLDYFKENSTDIEKFEEWYDEICELTYTHLTIPNPDYIKEEDYPGYEDVKQYKYELNEEKRKIYEDWWFVWAKKYLNRDYIYTGRFEAGIKDDKCFVSASGWGDGGYECFVGRNENDEIVSIKIKYIYEEDEEFFDE